MTGMIPSMSCATHAKVKPCTECRVCTVTVRETIAGCGSVNGLFQEQCSSAAGVPGVNMVNKLTLTPSAKTQE